MSNLEFTHNSKLLTAVGSDNVSIRNSGSSLLQITVGGNTVLHIAAMEGKLNLAAEALMQKPELLVMQNAQGDTPLHLAARAGQVKMVEHFVSDRPLSLSLHVLFHVMNNFGNTVLHEAVQHDCLQVVKVLLRKAPSASALLTSTRGESALYMAAVRCSMDIVSRLLRIDEASCEGPDGQTALHAAVSRASYEMACSLAQKRPTLLTRVDKAGNTALHLAALNGYCRMVQVLLESDLSVVHARNKVGLTPIHVATRSGHLGVVQFLIDKCPDCVEQVDNNGRNFFHVAIRKGVVSVIDHVLESATLIKLVNVPDNEGNTPLHLAVLSKRDSVLKKLTSRREFISGAINHKGDTAFDVVLYADKASGSLVSLKSEVAKRMMMLMECTSSQFIDPLRFGTPQLEHIQKSLRRRQDIANENDEATQYKKIFKNISVVAVLIATATFAAVLALPGGFQSDQGEDPGTAWLAKRLAFDAFLFFDTFAMVISLLIIVRAWGLGPPSYQLYTIYSSAGLLSDAIAAFMLAFGCGVFVVIADKRLYLGIVVCLMVFAPVGVTIVSYLTSGVCCIFRDARSSKYISHVYLETSMLVPSRSFWIYLKQSSPFLNIYDKMLIYRLGPRRLGNYDLAWDIIYPGHSGYSMTERTPKAEPNA